MREPEGTRIVGRDVGYPHRRNWSVFKHLPASAVIVLGLRLQTGFTNPVQKAWGQLRDGQAPAPDVEFALLRIIDQRGLDHPRSRCDLLLRGPAVTLAINREVVVVHTTAPTQGHDAAPGMPARKGCDDCSERRPPRQPSHIEWIPPV